ncbi:hypothetical protein QQP08_019713 [Theobroma cacao]|nr:hypothetical protein QQP08_019713 [Theobroma cacao]
MYLLASWRVWYFGYGSKRLRPVRVSFLMVLLHGFDWFLDFNETEEYCFRNSLDCVPSSYEDENIEGKSKAKL